MAIKFCFLLFPGLGLLICPALVVVRIIFGSTLKLLKEADDGGQCAMVCAGLVLLRGSQRALHPLIVQTRHLVDVYWAEAEIILKGGKQKIFMLSLYEIIICGGRGT